MKFRIESPQHSEQIQRELIRLGYRYSFLSDSKNPQYTLAPFIFATHSDKRYETEYSKVSFQRCVFTETTLEELKAM